MLFSRKDRGVGQAGGSRSRRGEGEVRCIKMCKGFVDMDLC